MMVEIEETKSAESEPELRQEEASDPGKEDTPPECQSPNPDGREHRMSETTTGTTSLAKEDKPGADEKVELADESGKTSNGVAAMELNVAYEALEQVRQANVGIEFGRDVPPKECILCLREPQPTSRFRMPKLNRGAPCLTCGTPVCPRHRCPELKRENINICVDCSAFFNLDEFVQQIHASEDTAMRKRQMNHMLDVYDRALLILQYSSQYIEEIAISLERNTERNNKIGLGSSATGFVSGIAGVAAACTIFTPAGPPLLIASILFGGGATAVSASSESVNYHCSANKMADTIYALHGMVHSISRLAIEGHLWERELAQDNNNEGSTAGQGQPLNANTNQAQKRNWTRATANALKPLTAGALSAASVVMEAREMRNTLDKINAGNPCEKAESLRKIGREMDMLPSTPLLAEIAPQFFKLE